MNQTTTQPTATDLRKAAVLIELNTGNFSGTVRSDRAARQLADANGADERALRAYYGALTDQDRSSITTPISQARREIDANTVPWETKGRKACPVESLQRLLDFLDEREREFTAAAEALVDRYDELTDTARNRAGALWDSSKWPSRAKLARSFKWGVTVEPIPVSDDFRFTHVNQDVLDRATTAMETSLRQRYEDMNRNLASRLTEMLARAADTLEQPDKIFRDSLIGNLRKACRELPTLNLSNNAQLDNLFSRINSELASAYDPQELRDSPTARHQAAKKARSLLGDLAGLFDDETSEAPEPPRAPADWDEAQAEAAAEEAPWADEDPPDNPDEPEICKGCQLTDCEGCLSPADDPDDDDHIATDEERSYGPQQTRRRSILSGADMLAGLL